MTEEIPEQQEVHTNDPDVVWAEGAGVGVAEHDEGPVFAVALHMPGGGKAMRQLDAIGAIEYAAALLTAVAATMTKYEQARLAAEEEDRNAG